jgi:hypothetical protein
MPVSDALTKHSEEWIDQHEADLCPRTYPQVSNVCSIDWDQFASEDKIGCARGVVWAIVFEAVLGIAAVAYWKLRHFPH